MVVVGGGGGAVVVVGWWGHHFAGGAAWLSGDQVTFPLITTKINGQIGFTVSNQPAIGAPTKWCSVRVISGVW